MKALIQRVSKASVDVDNITVGQIQRGILLMVGMEKNDDDAVISKMADKVIAYRIFPDQNQKMNLSLRDISGGILVISQFTLAADTNKGLRPSFSRAAPPALAQLRYQRFIDVLRTRHHRVETGVFAADMKVSLVNDGPVTFQLEIS